MAAIRTLNSMDADMLQRLLTFRNVSYFLAAILAITAALKLHLLLTDPFADIKTGKSFPLLWLAVVIESLAVYAVLARLPERFQWWVLLLVFSGFAFFATWSVAGGSQNCGCAGSLSVKPFWALLFDVTTLFLLVLVRPTIGVASRFLTPAQLGNLCGFTIVTSLFFAIQLTPIAEASRYWFYGRLVSADPVVVKLPMSESPFTTKVCFKNTSNEEIMVIGFKKSCRCIHVEDFEQSKLPARGELIWEIEIEPNRSGDFHHRITLFLNSTRQLTVSAEIVGEFY